MSEWKHGYLAYASTLERKAIDSAPGWATYWRALPVEFSPPRVDGDKMKVDTITRIEYNFELPGRIETMRLGWMPLCCSAANGRGTS